MRKFCSSFSFVLPLQSSPSMLNTSKLASARTTAMCARHEFQMITAFRIPIHCVLTQVYTAIVWSSNASASNLSAKHEACVKVNPANNTDVSCIPCDSISDPAHAHSVSTVAASSACEDVQATPVPELQSCRYTSECQNGFECVGETHNDPFDLACDLSSRYCYCLHLCHECRSQP